MSKKDKQTVTRFLDEADSQIARQEKYRFTGSKQTLRGQILAFILGLITIIGGLYLISQGKDIQGYRLLIGTAATLVSVFIYGKHQNKKERIEKARLNPEKN